MNAVQMPTREQHIKGGVFWLMVLLAAGYVAPRFVGALLMLFSALVFVLAVIGLTWPELMRLPNPAGVGVDLRALGGSVPGRRHAPSAAERDLDGVGYATRGGATGSEIGPHAIGERP